MAARLEKFSIIDPRVDLSAEFKRWVSTFGAKEVNFVSTPSGGGANNTSSSFSIQLSDSETCVLDRSSCELVVPITITLQGTAAPTVPPVYIYNPDFEGLRNRPLERVIKKLDIRAAGGQAASFEPYRMVDAMECFTFDSKQRQTEPDQIDNCQSYSSYNGTNASPFAPRFDNPYRASRRAMSQITVVSNTNSLAVLQTTLKMNLQDYPPFTNEVIHTGFNAQPLKIDISWYDFLSRIWCRDTTNHPQQNLTNVIVTLGQATVNLLSLTLPFNQTIPPEQNFPYHQVETNIVQTVTNVTAGATFTFNSNIMQLSYVPACVYVFAKPSDGWVTNNVTNIVATPNCFAELMNISVDFANRSGILATYEQEYIYQMAKSNGLIPMYAYCDWLGEQFGNTLYPLRGSIFAADIVKDICCASKTITTGISDKLNFAVRGTMKNISSQTRDFDIVVISVYEGIFSVINRNLGMTNLTVIENLGELKPLDIPYSQAMAMMGGGDGGDAKAFFRGLWSKIKSVIPIIKKSGIVGTVLGAIPQTAALVPIARNLGWGEGEGEGLVAYGEGAYYKKKAPRRRTARAGEGGYLM